MMIKKLKILFSSYRTYPPYSTYLTWRNRGNVKLNY